MVFNLKERDTMPESGGFRKSDDSENTEPDVFIASMETNMAKEEINCIGNKRKESYLLSQVAGIGELGQITLQNQEEYEKCHETHWWSYPHQGIQRN
ncbi:hypothetical protein CEXT_155421 [Caerostris extrusa]|uniref:Uncharacterized protein n=1 Tax=Caerostris extrusa TaxID=172846 RepID=A0AAV4WXY7_CAEEX|nr:hypothetical protein CEXT_155421 [Caerostris extrusa]